MKNFKKVIYCLYAVSITALVSCTNDREPLVPIDNNQDQLAYDAASAVVGSQLYNDFTKTPGYDGPKDANVNPDDILNFKDFYRCKQCHAWDLKARFASYINRKPKMSRPDVSSVQLVNLSGVEIKYLFDKIKNTGGAAVDPARTADGTNPSLGGNEHPDFGTILTDAQIWDLVKFLREGAFDVDNLYAVNLSGTYPTGTISYSNLGFDGSESVGQTFYNTNCASCHGADGTTINLAGNSIGGFVRNKPYELQHKVQSGQLGSIMGPTAVSLEEMKGLLKYASNLTTFPDIN